MPVSPAGSFDFVSAEPSRSARPGVPFSTNQRIRAQLADWIDLPVWQRESSIDPFKFNASEVPFIDLKSMPSLLSSDSEKQHQNFAKRHGINHEMANWITQKQPHRTDHLSFAAS